MDVFLCPCCFSTSSSLASVLLWFLRSSPPPSQPPKAVKIEFQEDSGEGQANPSHHRPPGVDPVTQTSPPSHLAQIRRLNRADPDPISAQVQTRSPPCTARFRSESRPTSRAPPPGPPPRLFPVTIPPAPALIVVSQNQIGFRPPVSFVKPGEEDGVDDKLEDQLVPLASGVDEGLIGKTRDQSVLLSIVRVDTRFKAKVRDLFVLLANSILPGADVGFKEKLKDPCVLFAEAFSQVGDGAHLGE